MLAQVWYPRKPYRVIKTESVFIRIRSPVQSRLQKGYSLLRIIIQPNDVIAAELPYADNIDISKWIL
ncbi:unnamed protein product, partial [Ceratitis capitata]